MRRTELSAEPGHVAVLTDALRGLKFLAAIPPATLEAVVRSGALVELDAGDLLIREGDLKADELYLMLAGCLIVRSGDRHISRITHPGEVVGEIAVLQAPPRSADVLADAPSRVLAIQASVLGNPDFSDFSAVFYQMLSYGLANKLRALTVQSIKRLDRVEHEAATDPLTGLANRKRLDEVLATLASAQSGLPFSLAMIDVDKFKNYNDAHGHPLGDVVLTKLAGLMQSQVRKGDLAARYGGEEFVLVLPNCDASDARLLAEKFRARVESEDFPKAQTQPGGRLTVTLGVATFNGAETIGQLLQRADQALYRGKAAGRNVVVVSE